MMLYPGFPQAVKAAPCVICAGSIGFGQKSQSSHNVVCPRAECRWRYALLRQQGRVCPICGRLRSLTKNASGGCISPEECRRQAAAQQARKHYLQRKHQEEQLQKRAGRLREQILERFGIREPETFPLAIVPGVVPRIGRLSIKRRRGFRHHLQHLIEQAVALPLASAEGALNSMLAGGTHSAFANESNWEHRLQIVSNSACACCRGFCCLGGYHNYAYLNVETIHRYRAGHPQHSPRQILTAYLRFVDEETCVGSCVYHRAKGCSLPRELRSAVCNEFYCGGLQQLRADLPTVGRVRAFLVAANDWIIHRAALMDEGHLLVISEPETED